MDVITDRIFNRYFMKMKADIDSKKFPALMREMFEEVIITYNDEMYGQEVHNMVKSSTLLELKELIEKALYPKVTFNEDFSSMRDEKDNVVESALFDLNSLIDSIIRGEN